MSYQSRHIQIRDMQFSANVSEIEFEQWLSELETLLQAKQYFVLLIQTDPDATFPESYRKAQSIWYKKNKQQFFQYCLGLVRIAQNAADQLRLNKPALHASWRVPYYVTLQRADALQWAVQRWL